MCCLFSWMMMIRDDDRVRWDQEVKMDGLAIDDDDDFDWREGKNAKAAAIGQKRQRAGELEASLLRNRR